MLDINSDIFLAALSLFSILVIIESLKPGYVSFFFNLSIVVPVILITGAIAVLAGKNQGDSDNSI